MYQIWVCTFHVSVIALILFKLLNKKVLTANLDLIIHGSLSGEKNE